MIASGPVPSRRLGRRLGINNIPPKSCTYSRVYCQVGPTAMTEATARAFYPPEEILRSVAQRLEALARRGEGVDWLTFVPDSETTVDANLGATIDLLRPVGIPIAVITNSSLLWRAGVRAALLIKADWLSVKVDATDPEVGTRIDRPDPILQLDTILADTTRLAADCQRSFAQWGLIATGCLGPP
jgi:wyosine [tRNA(Phe)-imidazoG37] synthetase (radical SAM superfamily)